MDLIAALSASTSLEKLRTEFPRDIDEGLDLATFVKLLKRQLSGFIKDELSFGVQAVDLFKLMDVRGDGEVSWRDFTDYVLQLDLLAEGVRGKLQQRAAYQPLATKREDVDFATSISRMSYLPQPIGKVALVQDTCDVVHLLTRPQELSDRPRSIMVLRHLTAYKAHEVLACVCLQGQDTVVCSSTSGLGGACFITFWDLPTEEERTSGEQYLPVLSKRIETTLPMACLFFSPRLEMVLGGSHGSGMLMGYDASNYDNKIKLRIHNAGITGILEIDGGTTKGNSFILTGSKDGNICILTIKKRQNKETICLDSRDAVNWMGAHEHGVLHLAHAEHHGLVISSGMMTHWSKSSPSVMVWKVDPLKGLSRTVLKHIFEHHAQVCGIAVVEHLDHFVTGDEAGQVLVWDLNTLNLLQEFNEENLPPLGLPALTTICSLPRERQRPDEPPLLLTASNDEIRIFQWQKQRITDPLIEVAYNERFRSLITASAVQLVIWNAETGAFIRLHTAEELTGESGRDITAFCLDNKGRKLIVGDDSGHINVCDFTNGRRIKQLDPQNQMITWIHYPSPDTDACVLSTSMDGTLQVLDESDALGYHDADKKRGLAARSIRLKHIRFVHDNATGSRPSTARMMDMSSTSSIDPSPRPFSKVRRVSNLQQALNYSTSSPKSKHFSNKSKVRSSSILPEVASPKVLGAEDKQPSLDPRFSSGSRGIKSRRRMSRNMQKSRNSSTMTNLSTLLGMEPGKFGMTFELLTCAIDVGLNLVATASQSGPNDQHVNVWDYEMCSLKGACVLPRNERLPELLPSALTFLAPHRLLACSSLSGVVYLWRMPTCEATAIVMRPFLEPACMLTSVCYAMMTITEKKKGEISEVTSMAEGGSLSRKSMDFSAAEDGFQSMASELSHSKEVHHIFAGDEHGTILVYKFSAQELAELIGPDIKEEGDRPVHNPYRVVNVTLGSEQLQNVKRSANHHQRGLPFHEKEFTYQWRAHDDQISSVRFIQSCSVLASASSDSTAKLWLVNEGSQLLGVLDVNCPSPALGKWRLGELLEGVGEDGRLQANIEQAIGVLSIMTSEDRHTLSRKVRKGSTAFERLDMSSTTSTKARSVQEEQEPSQQQDNVSALHNMGGAGSLEWGDMMQKLQIFEHNIKEQRDNMPSNNLAEMRSKEPSMGTKWKFRKEDMQVSGSLYRPNRVALRSQMLQQVKGTTKPRSVDFHPALKKKYEKALAKVDETLFYSQQALHNSESQQLGHTNSLLVSGSLKKQQKQKKVSTKASIKYNLSKSVPELMPVNISASETRLRRKQHIPEPTKAKRCSQTNTINKLAHMGLL